MRPQVQDAQDVELVSPADDLVEANGRAEFDVADSQVGQRRHARPRARFSIQRNVLRTTLFARIYDIVLQRLCRSEEHTSELQSLIRISYAVLCLKHKNNTIQQH